ncbi:dihydrofolate reductase family protein [Paenibacillus qinlingensis]|uniref:dihydrofolate reductase family protein n=1 Tax=Paenibacillus qinlingensis TaxID=1837343 RepID=UPI0030822BF7
MADEYPYPGKESYVFSRTKQVPDSNVTYVTEEIPALIEKLKEREGSKIWVVGGAAILDTLLKVRLVDEFIIAIMPMILGIGIPFFKKDNPEM